MPYAPNSASAVFARVCRPRKCSTTRDVIRILTDDTNASANADGKTVKTSPGLHEKPTNGGSVAVMAPISFSWKPRIRSRMIASPDQRRGGARGKLGGCRRRKNHRQAKSQRHQAHAAHRREQRKQLWHRGTS